MKLTISISGQYELASNVKYIQQAMAGALADIVKTGAFPIENEAKVLSPKKTGTNARSIHTEVVESTPARARARIGPSTPYGARLCFGFVGADSRGRKYNQAPRPYMRPAYETKKQQAHDDMRATATEFLQGALDSAVSGGKR
jgi:hypothetical protein